jgi:flagellar motility protein MotE (MotC chaperone)
LALFLIVVLIFLGIAAYELNRRGFLSQKTLEILSWEPQEPEFERPPLIDPVELAVAVQAKQQKLDEQAEGLQELAERLEQQRRELETERSAIQSQLEKLESLTEAEAAARNEKTARLVKMYETMAPEQAAAVLENLPDATVADILFQMRERRAAQIMDSLSPDKAADVTKLISLQTIEITG